MSTRPELVVFRFQSHLIRLPFVLGLVWLMSQNTPSLAQGGPVAQAAGGVDVTPDGGTDPKRAPSGTYTTQFSVTNTGTFQYTFTLVCGRTGAVASCTLDIDEIVVGAGATANVMVQYSTGAVGTGTVTLTASRTGASDQGSVNVTVWPTGKPGLALKNHNRDNRDLAQCLTVGGAGEAAAVSCGQLLVTHSTPTYATLGKERALTLVYRSGQAVGGAVVPAVITQRPNFAPPSALFLELKVKVGTTTWTVRDTATYNTIAWGGTGLNQPRQAVVWFMDTLATLGTGIYPVSIRAQNQYPATVEDSTIADTLIIVNRAGSDFGAGWSLAGVEQLYFNQPVGTTKGDILWVGGDGSARWYQKLDATHWRAPAGAFRDTLVLSGGEYTRTLRHGIKVVFDTLGGRHVRTVNRTTQYTLFTYDVNGRLSTIKVPPQGVSGTTYTLAYSSGKLDFISDPAGRVLNATVAGNRLLSLADPDTTLATYFSYGQSGAFPTLMTSRTSRRGFTASFTYQGNRVTQASVPHDTMSTTFAITGYAPWDIKGWNSHPHTAAQIAEDTAVVFTKITGPRPDAADDASFWIDRWGAPVRMVGAINDTTRIYRGASAVPALITRVEAPDGRVDSLVYDANGSLLKDSTAFGAGTSPAVSRWAYADANAPHSPDTAVAPGGIITKFKYNSWGLTERVTAPNGHITRFEYVPNGSLVGQFRAVWDSLVPVYSGGSKSVTARIHTGFALNTLGNVVADTSPLGRIRTLTRDGSQRVSDVYDPAGHHTVYAYNAANRLLRLIQFDSLGAPDTTLWAWRFETLDQVRDPRGVLRKYRYDPLGRVIAEFDDYNAPEIRWYNKGGLIDSLQMRTGHRVRWAYDAAGRMVKRAWPARDVDQADSVLFTYDIMGRLLKAKTAAYDSILRTYSATGLLKTEVSQGSAVNFSIGYGYDVAGRRIALRVGVPGDATRHDSVTYTYRGNGDLEKVIVRWRNSTVRDTVTFWWDSLGRRDSLHYSTDGVGTDISFAYDADGAMRLICGRGPDLGGQNPGVYDFRHVVDETDADGMPRRINFTNPNACLQGTPLPFLQDSLYNDTRHQMIRRRNADTRTWKYDKSGNRVDHTQSLGPVHIQDSLLPGHNRLEFSGDIPQVYTKFVYDSNGARVKEIPCTTPGCHPTWTGNVIFLYDGLGRSTGRQVWTADPGGYYWKGPICRYDALGRQRHLCETNAAALYYDGNNVVRTGTDVSTTAWTFIHGPGVDDPLMGKRESGQVYFFVTDGQGRNYVVGLGTGDPADMNVTGAKASGVTSNGTTFEAERLKSADIPSVSFFRNRWYDQGTARWTQEDPIGITGGLNLYQYTNNNPVMFSDPFGLAPCWLYSPLGRSCKSPNPYELAVVGKVALAAAGNPLKTLSLIFDMTQTAQGLAREKYGDKAFHNGKGDAFKHAYFSCTATQALGRSAAKELADAHEAQANQPEEEKKMDEKNNQAGRNLGRQGVDCEQAVTAALEGGALVTIE